MDLRSGGGCRRRRWCACLFQTRRRLRGDRTPRFRDESEAVRCKDKAKELRRGKVGQASHREVGGGCRGGDRGEPQRKGTGIAPESHGGTEQGEAKRETPHRKFSFSLFLLHPEVDKDGGNRSHNEIIGDRRSRGTSGLGRPVRGVMCGKYRASN